MWHCNDCGANFDEPDIEEEKFKTEYFGAIETTTSYTYFCPVPTCRSTDVDKIGDVCIDCE